MFVGMFAQKYNFFCTFVVQNECYAEQSQDKMDT